MALVENQKILDTDNVESSSLIRTLVVSSGYSVPHNTAAVIKLINSTSAGSISLNGTYLMSTTSVEGVGKIPTEINLKSGDVVIPSNTYLTIEEYA